MTAITGAVPSFLRIDYSLRPAKHVERQMLFEAFGRLSSFRSLREFSYVGFGSIDFRDLRLAHKRLGITRLTSVERDPEQRRFLFNRPFQGITMAWGNATDALRALRWRQPAIVWLDYEDRLTSEILDDVAFVCRRVASGSMLIVTVNAEQDLGDGSLIGPDLVEEEVGAEIQRRGDKSKLRKGELARMYYRLLSGQMATATALSNAALPPGDASARRFSQVVHFRYADGAEMLTVGGVVYSNGEAAALRACRFAELEFVRSGATPCVIAPFKLTFKERRRLDEMLPARDLIRLGDAAYRLLGVPPEFVRNYAQVYRYVPTYADADI